MSTKNRVFKKLAEETKVELSAQKVELAEYDFSKYMKDYDSSFTKQRSKVRDGLNSAKSALDLHFSDVNKILNSAEKEMDEFGEYPLSQPEYHNGSEYKETNSPYIKRFWKWFPIGDVTGVA